MIFLAIDSLLSSSFFTSSDFGSTVSSAAVLALSSSLFEDFGSTDYSDVEFA